MNPIVLRDSSKIFSVATKTTQFFQIKAIYSEGHYWQMREKAFFL